MKWGTLKKAVRDLGFEEDSIFDEYRSIFINSANRAIKSINRNVRPVTSYREVVQTGTETGFRRLDLSQESDFMGIYGTPVIETSDGISDFGNYRIEQDNVVVFDKSIAGTIRFFYRKLPTPITESTADNTELDVLKNVDVLLPLLTAYYVWLDDDKDKADAYYEKYTTLKNEILYDYQNNEIGIKATCIGGLPWQI